MKVNPGFFANWRRAYLIGAPSIWRPWAKGKARERLCCAMPSDGSRPRTNKVRKRKSAVYGFLGLGPRSIRRSEQNVGFLPGTSPCGVGASWPKCITNCCRCGFDERYFDPQENAPA